jgi:hypothetical protein
MSVQRGLDLQLYRNTGTYVGPVWNLVPNVRDLSLGRSKTQGDASSRQQSVKMSEPCLEDGQFGWDMVDESTDADLIAIESAYDGNDLMEFAFCDSAGVGIRYECKIFDVSEPQPLDGVNVINVKAMPCYTTNAQGQAVSIP